MSVRINKAKNFKGKAYVAADELDNLVKSLSFPASLETTDTAWNMTFTNLDGTSAPGVSAVDLISIKNYIDNKSITVTAGAGIQVITSNSTGAGSVLNPLIQADVDGTTIVLSGSGDTAKLATGLTLVKIGDASTTEGKAASYELQDANGTKIGDRIEIDKDRFLKDATFGWAAYESGTTTVDGSTFVLPGSESTSTPVPVIRFRVFTKDEGTDSDAAESTFYVDCHTFYREYDAQNGVEIVSGNVIEGVVDSRSEMVYTGIGNSFPVLSVGSSGFKVDHIQDAIDNAVRAEHNTAFFAIEDLESDVLAFASNTSAAVNTLNTRIETVAGNAQTAISNAVENLTSQISGVVTNADTATKALGAAIDSLDNNVSAAIADVNTKVEGAIDSTVGNVNTALTGTVASVNGAIGSTVTDVNTKVGNAITAVSGVIDNVQTAVGNAITAVSGVIDNAQTAVSNFKDSVNTTISAVVDDVNSAIADNIANRSTQLAGAIVVGKITSTPTETDTAGIYTTTVSATYILGVFGADKLQIYPEIEEGTTVGTFKLTADYGATQSSAEAWTIIAAQDLPDLGATATATTATASYTATGTTNVTYASQTNGASYSNATATNATVTATADVDAEDASYTQIADVANTGVVNGTAGTADTTVATGTAATAPATDGIAVQKAEPVYK